MTGDAVNLNLLFLEQNIVTNLQHANGTVEVGTHKVGEVELVAGRAYEHRTTLGQTCYRLTADVVVGHQTAAVGVTFESLVEELTVELVHVNLDTQQLLVLLEQAYPGVDVAGTVITVNHGYQRTVGSGYHINHLVRLGEFLLKHNHRE